MQIWVLCEPQPWLPGAARLMSGMVSPACWPLDTALSVLWPLSCQLVYPLVVWRLLPL